MVRNFTVLAMVRQFGGKGGPMKDRRACRGGAHNEERELLDEYLSDADDASRQTSITPNSRVVEV